MSRNLSEGNLSKDAAATEFGVRQLFRRPAPTAGGGVEVVHMYNWDYTSVNTVANTTWTSVCSLGGTDGFFKNIFYTAGFATGWNCAAGTVNTGISAEYSIQGWVQFNEDSVAGEQRFIAIDFGSSNRHIQQYIDMPSAHGILAFHLPVHAIYYGNPTLFMEVWHNHGSNISIRGAELSVKRMVATADGTATTC